jgi:hypothetical protein
MRVCEYGQQLDDPCNVKMDTEGCFATMGVEFKDGFTYTDKVLNTFQDFEVAAAGIASVEQMKGNVAALMSLSTTDVQITSTPVPVVDDDDDDADEKDTDGSGSYGYGRPLSSLLAITIFAWFL